MLCVRVFVCMCECLRACFVCVCVRACVCVCARARECCVCECVCVVCGRVEVSAADRSLVQRSHTECGVSECALDTSTMRRPRPTGTVEP